MTILDQDLITIILFAVFVGSLIGVLAIINWAYKSGPFSYKQERIAQFISPPVDNHHRTPLRDSFSLPNLDTSQFRTWINDSLGSLSSNDLKNKLSSAYWVITDTEFMLISITATVMVFFLGWLIPGNILGGILLGVITIIMPRFLLDRSIAQRQQKFHNQLLDVLILIKGAVQSGYSLMQSFDLAIKEVPAPASEEFGRVLREIRFGISLEGALFNLADRMENDDLQIVITAIIINSQVGGNLSTVLEATISTIRDRLHLMGEIRSLTSYARFVGYFLTLMPFISGALIFMLSPEYFETVKTSSITQIVYGMALVSVVIGNIWIKQTLKIRV
jgi:tight adherence protein B